ncbi:hypothetical protein SUGI_0537440 [Cryptomeria japonica]|uniref:homeobox-leucine zipper protein HOX11 n=1 Tax=Cryptomeria japonica TaxID=3369 RepID=UPI002408D07E|nr:homeobox-leucine zipper protein HOX11 [Cryptomeria japonica]GLJ27382.1 hypothetical protein SUGI_0537440 [Cryptomeria japonica]
MDVGDEECDTELGLGMRIRPSTPCGKNSADEELAMARQNIIDVSKLGLASCYSKQHGDTQFDNMVSFHKNTISSFPVDSNFANQESCHGVGIKRERESVTEDFEGDKGYCRVSDEDEEGGGTRKKLRLSKQQSAILEETFKEHSTLNPKQKQTLAKQLNLCPRQVEVWFQNRRARTKLKQNEVDCQFLKRCYESLTEENRRLQKELIELKSLKRAAVASPLYLKLQLPSTTIKVCPSCQRVITSDKNTPFTNLQEPHFYPCYSHSSVAY